MAMHRKVTRNEAPALGRGHPLAVADLEDATLERRRLTRGLPLGARAIGVDTGPDLGEQHPLPGDLAGPGRPGLDHLLDPDQAVQRSRVHQNALKGHQHRSALTGFAGRIVPAVASSRRA